MSQYPCGGPRSHAPLAIVGLVSRYLTNYLIARTPILEHLSFNHSKMPSCDTMGYYSQLPGAIPISRVGCVRVTHPCVGRHQSN